ncbi:MAG: electron-transfer flavoprotein:ubiquinone oxidoreductase [Chloroflexota bacterium]|nr:electron-transfer flavoprotein:ubiquinone oxidoreductase [Chloroflexota bacterium]
MSHNNASGLNKMDVLFVGAGPASLAGAIKLKQLLKAKGRNDSVVVIEKADKIGQHSLSGAVFEADVLEELVLGWQEDRSKFVAGMVKSKVVKDEVVFLLGNKLAIKVPHFIVPSYLKHHGDYLISVSELVNWLAQIARSLGVEIYNGFVAREVVVEGGVVTGVKLGDKGLDEKGQPQSNYVPGEMLKARVTVLGEGSLGLLSEQLVDKLNLGKNQNTQIQSLGVKEIIRLPQDSKFGHGHVVDTMGFPNKFFTPDIFGGGTFYSMGDNDVAVTINLALDWKYCDLDPHQELQLLKSHPFVAGILNEGKVMFYGAKTIPEGGYYSIPELVANGAIIVGDAAGLLSTRKLKGLHYAIKSGMLAAETISGALEKGDFSVQSLGKYTDLLHHSFVGRDLYGARNYRQLFARAGRFAMYLGTLNSFFHGMVRGRMKLKPDFQHTTTAKLARKYRGGIDKLTDVSLSGTTHREDEPSHITILNRALCTPCVARYGAAPCEAFCPGQVYRWDDGGIVLSPSNCLHCQTCRVKCPFQNIGWQLPEGGDGPKYKVM